MKGLIFLCYVYTNVSGLKTEVVLGEKWNSWKEKVYFVNNLLTKIFREFKMNKFYYFHSSSSLMGFLFGVGYINSCHTAYILLSWTDNQIKQIEYKSTSSFDLYSIYQEDGY